MHKNPQTFQFSSKSRLFCSRYQYLSYEANPVKQARTIKYHFLPIPIPASSPSRPEITDTSRLFLRLMLHAFRPTTTRIPILTFSLFILQLLPSCLGPLPSFLAVPTVQLFITVQIVTQVQTTASRAALDSFVGDFLATETGAPVLLVPAHV